MNVCRECSKIIEEPSNNEIGTGYATYSDGSKVCYECQGRLDLETLSSLTVNQYFPNVLYYGKNQITNWPGSMVIPCQITIGKHNWRDTEQIFVQFTYNGKNFYGRTVSGPASGNCIRIRRIKDD